MAGFLFVPCSQQCSVKDMRKKEEGPVLSAEANIGASFFCCACWWTKGRSSIGATGTHYTSRASSPKNYVLIGTLRGFCTSGR